MMHTPKEGQRASEEGKVRPEGGNQSGDRGAVPGSTPSAPRPNPARPSYLTIYNPDNFARTSPEAGSPQRSGIAFTGIPLENLAIAFLTCIALLTFFFPLVAMHAPIVGDQGISGYDVVSRISSFKDSLMPNHSAATPSQPTPGSADLPLSVRVAWLIPTLVLVAFVCALLSFVGSIRSHLSLVKKATMLGALSGIGAVIYVTIVNSDIHGWLQRSLDAGAKDLADNPFAGLFQGLGTALSNAFQVKPAGGLYVLAGCLVVSTFLAHVRLLSRFGTRFVAKEHDKQAHASYMGFAALLALTAAVFIVAHIVTSPNDRLGAQGQTHPASSAGPSQTSTRALSALEKQLRRAVGVQVIDKGFQKADYETVMHDGITIKCVFNNSSGRDIRGFRGTVVFNDVFGERVESIGLSYDKGLKAGEQKTWDGVIEFNPFIDADQKLRDTSLANLKVVWEPRTVLFVDGTKLGE